MKREVVSTGKAPKAIGPYSQAIKANGFIFCSGQIPFNSETDEMVTGSITDQTRQVFTNLRNVLDEAGSSLEKVVKVTVFLKNMDDFGEMNEEYARWFKDTPPARAAVEVARLPKDVGIEIQLIALA
ncbi:MAG: deaminase [Candidatus Lokiarchaeota archaeon]|nr:deaminase [Candidatus Lokiarchaeota archaeon]